jgi:hypothetical protein
MPSVNAENAAIFVATDAGVPLEFANSMKYSCLSNIA